MATSSKGSYQNTFKGANLVFPNRGVRTLLAEVMKFRKQLTKRDEFRSQSGWANALNQYMVEELNKLSDTLESITYSPDADDLDELESQASDTTRTLEDDYNERAISSDNVLMPA